jgi:hypothetical protein
MGDFLTFRKLITTQVIQVLFWIGSLVIVIASIGAIANDQALEGLLLLAFGLLYLRVVCEVFIVLFRMHDTLLSIKGDTAALPAVVGGGREPASSAARTEEPGSVAEPSRPAEGWYDDPARPGHKRWWDGTAWGASDDEQSPPG